MGFFDRFKKKEEPKEVEQLKSVEPIPPEPEPVKIPDYRFVGVPLRVDSWYLKYSYKNVPLLKLSSEKYYEGEGRIDEIGQVYKDEEMVGAVTDDQKVKMVADFIARHELIKVFFDGPESVRLAFYKEIRKAVESCPREVLKLTKTSAMDTVFEWRRYENLDGAQDGDQFTLEYDDELETYIVKDSADGEVGELTKSDSKRLYAKELEGCDLFAFATECDYDDRCRTICKVEVFIK